MDKLGVILFELVVELDSCAFYEVRIGQIHLVAQLVQFHHFQIDFCQLCPQSFQHIRIFLVFLLDLLLFVLIFVLRFHFFLLNRWLSKRKYVHLVVCPKCRIGRRVQKYKILIIYIFP